MLSIGSRPMDLMHVLFVVKVDQIIFPDGSITELHELHDAQIDWTRVVCLGTLGFPRKSIVNYVTSKSSGH